MMKKAVLSGSREQLTTIDGLELRLLRDAKEEVELLERRRRSARTGDHPDEGNSSFDDADILIVDYDLTASGEQQGGPAETGERVAYLARCYSKCGTIVALNQYNVTATFDLSLIGHISSFADINISGDQISNPAALGKTTGRIRSVVVAGPHGRLHASEKSRSVAHGQN